MFKTELMEQTKSAVELTMMRQLKACFDPKGIMNPGKVLKVGG
jgi:FAD/FMN-containing dehydrogenase